MADSALSPRPVTVEFQPFGRRVEATPGAPLLEAARSAGIALTSVCGGVGLCDSCRIRVVRGTVSPLTAHERETLDEDQLLAGYRLACQANVHGDAVVAVPPESVGAAQRLQLEWEGCAEVEGAAPADPVVRAVDVEVQAPTLGDARADVTRLRDAVQTRLGTAFRLTAPSVVSDLPCVLRDQQWKARAVVDEERLVAVLPFASPIHGLAVDVGTTKIAAYLVDLCSGRTVAADGVVNPQVAHGEDVISRIAFADRGAGDAAALHALLVQALNDSIARLCEAAGVGQATIVDAVVVGNTVMHHFACGLPVTQLGRAPYVAVVSDALAMTGRDLGLQLAAGARVYLPPNIAGYVGADHVAVLTAVGPPSDGRTRMIIDIGTNTEISLFAGGRLLSCSCASGPAFEGAHIACGMRAITGAIERVRIVGDAVRYQTVGGAPAIGICGSGVVDAVAELATRGGLDRHGGFRRDHPLFTMRGKDQVLVLAPAGEAGHNRELVLTRRDVTEIQLAKAAIRTGIEVLLRRAAVDVNDLDEVVIAGAFGSYVDLASARRIGMLPDVPARRFRQVGNAAGAGARQMLLSAGARRTAEQLASRAEYVDLTKDERFEDLFARALGFE